jgi:drug/metabolite transporter (DMT)-like permease
MNHLWILFTVLAAGGQTARNAMQRELTAVLGPVGATHVRFLFGFPFALIFLTGVCLALHRLPPVPVPMFWPTIVLGALTQIGGTALMLMTMEQRSFVVTVAYLKTEPVIVAILGFFILGDVLTPLMIAAILIATLGVVLISWRPGAVGGLRPALMGLSSGGMFAISAIGYRGAILLLHDQSYVMGATVALTVGLAVQTTVLSAYLALREPGVLGKIWNHRRQSAFAGFMGSAASEGWFLAFALATAASVRTLGLIDVLFAQFVSHVLHKQKTTVLEAAGIVLLVGGAMLLVYAHH